MNIRERFIIFLTSAGISQKELAEATGYSEAGLSKFINGKIQNVKSDLVVAISENYPKLNLYWLLLGKGEMWLTDNETLVLKGDASSALEKIESLQQENQDLRNLLQSKEEIIRLLKERK